MHTFVVYCHMQNGPLDIDRPQKLSINELMNDPTDAHRIQLVLVTDQHMLVGQPLDIF